MMAGFKPIAKSLRLHPLLGLDPFLVKSGGEFIKIGHEGITIDRPSLYKKWAGGFVINSNGKSIIEKLERIIWEF